MENTFFQTTLTIPATIKKVIAGYTFAIDMTQAPDESLVWALTYGLRGVNDAANRDAKAWRDANGHTTDTKWPRASSQAYVDSFMDGTIAESARRAAGASVVDPVQMAAIKVASDHILSKLGDLTWKEAAADPRGAKYFKVSDKGNVSRNDAAVAEYLTKYDAAIWAKATETTPRTPGDTSDEAHAEDIARVAALSTFMGRAAVIVAATATDDSDVDVDL